MKKDINKIIEEKHFIKFIKSAEPDLSTGTYCKALYYCEDCGKEFVDMSMNVSQKGCKYCRTLSKNYKGGNKDYYLYLVSIDDSYIGYGITSNYLDRTKNGINSLVRTGFKAKALGAFLLPKPDAQLVESKLKLLFPTFNIDTYNYKTEHTHISYKDELVEFILNETECKFFTDAKLRELYKTL